MKKTYLALVREEDGGYTVSFPDIPGCYTEADSVSELLSNATEALSGHIKCMVDDGDNIPEPSSLKSVKVLAKKEKDVAIVFPVDIYMPRKTERINITTTGDKLEAIDNYAKKHRISRSELIVNAALEFIHQHA